MKDFEGRAEVIRENAKTPKIIARSLKKLSFDIKTVFKINLEE
jgi:hypothetical protein